MNINNLDDLLSLSGSDFKLMAGNLGKPVTNVSTPTKIKQGSLVFISTQEHWAQCLVSRPPLVITVDSLEISTVPDDICLVATKNIKKAMSLVLPLFNHSPQKSYSGIHPTSSFAGDVSIGNMVSIGAFCSIGNNVQIGDNTWIGPHVVIEDGVTIGSNTIIPGHVFIGYNCQIGNHCQIHAHTSIGTDGFGFFTNSHYQHSKVPQIGNVIIGDHVEIGSGCCIDRGTIDSTSIGSGSKLDNLCHIAHNCTVGENAMIAAGFFVAGSTQLGHRFTTGGNTVVSTQLTIADGVMLAGRSTVTNHITEAGQYGGYPLQPLKEALKTISTLGTIVEMRKKINLILKTLSIKD